MLFKANVAASEAYNNALEQHLRDTLGVWFVERPGTDPAERPIREILGIDPRLNQRWPTRRAHINIRRSDPRSSCSKIMAARRPGRGAASGAAGDPRDAGRQARTPLPDRSNARRG